MMPWIKMREVWAVEPSNADLKEKIRTNTVG